MNYYPHYLEFNSVGRYLAFIKHEIMTENWSQLTGENKPFFSFEKPIYYEDKNGNIKNNIKNIAEVTDLDYTLFRFVDGKPLIEFIDSINYFQNLIYDKWEKSEIWKSCNLEPWIKWGRHIKRILDDFKNVPEIIIKNHLRSQLHYIYNEIYENLTQPVSINYFASKMNWKKEQLANKKYADEIPQPVAIIESRPIWTLGQVENYYFLQNKLDIEKLFFNFPLPQVFTISQQENGEYIFNNDRKYYYGNDIKNLEDDNVSFSTALSIKNFLLKKIELPPELFWSLGRKYLKAENYDKAEYYLLKARDIYSSVIPEEFNAIISYEEEPIFYFTLLDLGFVYKMKGNHLKAKENIAKADYVSNEELDLSNLQDLEKFCYWYQGMLNNY